MGAPRALKQDADAVRVVGLAEFRAALKAVDVALPKEVGQLNKRVGEKVVGWSQSTASGVGRQAAKAADTMRASAAQANAFVTIGGNAVDFALGAVFGARRGVQRGTRSGPMVGWNQFQPWRGNQWQDGEFPEAGVGYFFVSDVREHRDEIEQMYLDGVEEISRLAFPD